MKIGLFDSGLGGLLVLKAVVKRLPEFDYVYYGDTANVPYGDKTEEQVFELTKQGLAELFARDCMLVVVACNTASAETLRRLQDTYVRELFPDRRVLGVIVPTIETLVASTARRAILLATKRTVESNKYARELAKLSSSIELVSIAAPILVPLIETHEVHKAALEAIEILSPQVRGGDVVLLGCTHYILLKDVLREHFASSVTFISQDEVIPDKLDSYLKRHTEIAQCLSGTGKRDIILTKHRPDYDRLTAEFLGGAYIAD